MCFLSSKALASPLHFILFRVVYYFCFALSYCVASARHRIASIFCALEMRHRKDQKRGPFPRKKNASCSNRATTRQRGHHDTQPQQQQHDIRKECLRCVRSKEKQRGQHCATWNRTRIASPDPPVFLVSLLLSMCTLSCCKDFYLFTSERRKSL